ncbi:MAG TPA: ORF6N domain-containing protein [Candidatus Acidoferrum sp.]|nr:ORF6N domain-containing protein [Candidatus Acidoferrum sp.]
MPGKSESLIPIEQIDGMIRTIRGSRVILDSDRAKICGVPTFRFNEAIKRNRHRFPPDFMFQLTTEEAAALRSQIAILKETAGERLTPNSSQIAILKKGRGQHRKYRPYAFTEHGALQAANVLRSPRAVQMSVFVIRAFVRMRQTLLGTRELAEKLAALEKKLTSRLDVHEAAIVEVLQELMQILSPPPALPEPTKPRIGFTP